MSIHSEKPKAFSIRKALMPELVSISSEFKFMPLKEIRKKIARQRKKCSGAQYIEKNN